MPAVSCLPWQAASGPLLVFFSAVLLVLFSPKASAASADGSVRKLPVVGRQDIRFVPLTSGSQVFNGSVHAFAQDNLGFIWMASDTGLYRYDGYVLKRFGHDPNDPGSISSNDVKTLFKDRDGILWIGTGSGLDRFDPASGAISHFRFQPGVAGGLSGGTFTCT